MEALILYLILFLPGIHITPPWLAERIFDAQTLPFSVKDILWRFVTHTLPAITLLLFLIIRKNFSSVKMTLLAARPGKQDLLPFAMGLPALIIIGLFVSFLVSLSAEIYHPLRIEGPYNALGWFVMILACLGTGYLEEIYFRYYLLSHTKNIIPQTAVRVIFSTLLFAVCHIHDGPWGMLNAAIAGLFLSALFIRYRSLHGVALAHAGYNMFVYVVGVVA